MVRTQLASFTAVCVLAAMGLAFAGDDVPATPFRPVDCPGVYKQHLQGICTNDRDAIYWSFTTELVKTDASGALLKKIPVGSHHGDLCHHDGKIYVAVNFGKFNDPAGNADSWVYVYDAADLSLVAKHKTPEVIHGAGGIAYHDGRFIVVGGLPLGVKENYLYEYDDDLRFVKKHVVDSGYTRLGIQTVTFWDGHWWCGCYGTELLKLDEAFRMVGKYDFDCAVGVAGIAQGTFLIARGPCSKETGCVGKVLVAGADADHGMVIRSE